MKKHWEDTTLEPTENKHEKKLFKGLCGQAEHEVATFRDSILSYLTMLHSGGSLAFWTQNLNEFKQDLSRKRLEGLHSKFKYIN
jgi:hypothetical protein